MFKIIDKTPIKYSKADEAHEEKLTGLFNSGIKFENVEFFYPSRSEVKVLNKVSFVITQGQTVALVGKSGCGKSTLIQLLQRFYEITNGSILIDGKEINTFNKKQFRRQLGVVNQEPVLFSNKSYLLIYIFDFTLTCTSKFNAY